MERIKKSESPAGKCKWLNFVVTFSVFTHVLEGFQLSKTFIHFLPESAYFVYTWHEFHMNQLTASHMTLGARVGLFFPFKTFTRPITIINIITVFWTPLAPELTFFSWAERQLCWLVFYSWFDSVQDLHQFEAQNICSQRVTCIILSKK